MQVDVVVIGAGGGGYPAAFRLARSGCKVVMVDGKGNLGGNCLYEGCIPSKSVRQATVVWHEAQQAEFFGLDVQAHNAPWAGIRAYKDGVQTRRYAQHLEEIQSTPNLTFIRGTARLIDESHVQVDDWDRQTALTVGTRDILLATGSEATPLAIPGFEQCWDHHDLFAWNDAVASLPHDVVILGGGYIGVESASMLQDLGVQVTLLEMAPSILPTMDAELVKQVADSLGKRITLVTGVQVQRVEQIGGRFQVTGRRMDDQGLLQIEAEQVLAALGRRPFMPADLGLDALGIAHTKEGITVDAQMRTSVPHIYAAGDVTGLSMLFHSAVRMSEVAAHTILSQGQSPDRFVPEAMPTTVFSRPELFSVGLTSAMAGARGLSVFEVSRPMGVEAWAQIVGEVQGQLKFVVDRSNGRIVGIHGVGVSSVELSAAAHMAVQLGLTPQQLGSMTFPHPTQFEALDRLARSI